MSKRWTREDDIFLATFHALGANYIADHDLGFKGKNAGEARMKLLKDRGVWDMLQQKIAADENFTDAWNIAFGPEWAKALSYSRLYGEEEQVVK